MWFVNKNNAGPCLYESIQYCIAYKGCSRCEFVPIDYITVWNYFFKNVFKGNRINALRIAFQRKKRINPQNIIIQIKIIIQTLRTSNFGQCFLAFIGFISANSSLTSLKKTLKNTCLLSMCSNSFLYDHGHSFCKLRANIFHLNWIVIQNYTTKHRPLKQLGLYSIVYFDGHMLKTAIHCAELRNHLKGIRQTHDTTLNKPRSDIIYLLRFQSILFLFTTCLSNVVRVVISATRQKK